MAVMNFDVQFVSTQYIKENSITPEYLDDKYLTFAIQDAQNIELQNVLGSPLYEEVVNYERDYLASGVTMPTEYSTLINSYIKPFLVNIIIYRALDSIWAKSMNTSVVIKTDATNSRPVTRDELNEDKRRYIQIYEWYRDMLARYLTTQHNNYGYFPKISEFTSDTDTILPDRGPGYGRTGLYFNRRNNRNYWGPGDSIQYGDGPTSDERGSADQ